MNTLIYNIDIDDFVDKFMPGFLRTYDISIKDGDIETGDTQEQEMFFIMKAFPGNYYYYPRLGYGLDSKLNANINKREEERLLKEQLRYDGFVVEEINIVTIADKKNITDPELLSILENDKVLFQVKAYK